MSRVTSKVMELRQSIIAFSHDQPLKLLYYTTLLIGLIIRLIVSLQTWGMKHPDEIYQSLEIAHYLVYGTGYIPPEFQSSYLPIPSYAASRSWLFPLFFSMFMRFGEFFAMDYHHGILPMIKVYMAIHSTLLIPAVYKLTYQISKEELTATLAAFLVTFWYRIIEYTARTFTNTFFLPMIFYGVYKVIQIQEREDHASLLELLEIGFLLGLSTYIRVDMGIIIFAFFVVYFQWSSIVEYLKIGFFSLLYWLWGAWIDYNLYDGTKYFSVIINWFTFNIIEGRSELFGVSSPLAYVYILILTDLLIIWLAIMIIWPLLSWIRKPENSIFQSQIGSVFRRIGLVTLITWIIYSNPWPIIDLSNGISISVRYSHKEIRFVIGALVIFLIATAVLIRLLLSELPTFAKGIDKIEPDMIGISSAKLKKYRRIILVSLLSIFLITNSVAIAVHQPTDHYEGINRSLVYIGSTNSQPTDIYIAEVWFVTGYYTYSHVSEQTTFHFHPVHREQNRKYHINIINSTIYIQPNNTYLVIPQYAESGFPSIWYHLEYNNWSLVYENNDNYTFLH